MTPIVVRVRVDGPARRLRHVPWRLPASAGLLMALHAAITGTFGTVAATDARALAGALIFSFTGSMGVVVAVGAAVRAATGRVNVLGGAIAMASTAVCWVQGHATVVLASMGEPVSGREPVLVALFIPLWFSPMWSLVVEADEL